MYIMDMPQMKRDIDIQKWADEIKMFAAKMEELTGNTITIDGLNDAIKTINNKRKALARIFDARKCADNIPISGLDALLIMQIAFFDDPARCAEMATRLLTSSSRETKTASPYSRQAPRGSCSQVHRLQFRTGSCITSSRPAAQPLSAKRCAQAHVISRTLSTKTMRHSMTRTWLCPSVT